MVVMDEMKLQYEPNAFYRWSLKGKTPVQRFARSKEKQISFFGGLSHKTKKQIILMSEERQNSETMIAYLEQMKAYYQEEIEARRKELEIIRRQSIRLEDKKYHGLILVVLDGASFHRSQELKAWLQKNYGIFELMRFPAYSPNLNPEEKVWKALRKYLSKVAGVYSWQETVDRACRFLLTQTFDFAFV